MRKQRQLVGIDPSLYTKVSLHALLTGQTIKSLTEKALTEYLAKQAVEANLATVKISIFKRFLREVVAEWLGK